MEFKNTPYYVVHNNWERSTVYDNKDKPIAEFLIDYFATDEDLRDENLKNKEYNANIYAMLPKIYKALEKENNILRKIISHINRNCPIGELFLEINDAFCDGENTLRKIYELNRELIEEENN